MMRVAIGLGVAQTIAWACTYYLPAVIAAEVAAAHGISRTLVVAAFSAALLVSGVCAPRIGRLIESRGGRGVLAGSAAVIALGLALLGLLPGLWGWVVGWLVLGWLSRRFEERLRPGDLTALYLFWYPLGRFWIESLRIDAWTIGRLATAQWISLGLVVGSAVFLIGRRLISKTPEGVQPG